jgi:uncharacterized membrane protein YfcA
VMFIFLGAVICSAASLQLLGWSPRAPTKPGPRAALEATTGLVAGVCGGLSGVWAPPILFFLVALDLDKALHIRALGLSLLVGSMILVPAHFHSGLLDRATFPLSLAMCLPMMAGMLIGQKFQDRMDQALFRKVALAVLCVAGLNLLRRGLM